MSRIATRSIQKIQNIMETENTQNIVKSEYHQPSNLIPVKQVLSEAESRFLWNYAVEQKRAEREFKRGKLLGESEGAIPDTALTKNQRTKITLILHHVCDFLCNDLDSPVYLAESLRPIVRNEKGRGLLDQLNRSLPKSGGDFEVAWAREGLRLISGLLNNSTSETFMKINDWSKGAIDWTPYPSPISAEEIDEGRSRNMRFPIDSLLPGT